MPLAWSPKLRKPILEKSGFERSEGGARSITVLAKFPNDSSVAGNNIRPEHLVNRPEQAVHEDKAGTSRLPARPSWPQSSPHIKTEAIFPWMSPHVEGETQKKKSIASSPSEPAAPDSTKWTPHLKAGVAFPWMSPHVEAESHEDAGTVNSPAEPPTSDPRTWMDVQNEMSIIKGLRMQKELITEYSMELFQEKLHEAWKATAHSTCKQKQARVAVCLEVQARVLPKYGFPATRKGVQMTEIAFAEGGLTKSLMVNKNSVRMEWLTNPALQAGYPDGPPADTRRALEWINDPSLRAEYPFGPPAPAPSNVQDSAEQRVASTDPKVAVCIVGGLSGEQICVVEVTRSESVYDLKRAVKQKAAVLEREQQLLLHNRMLHDTELVGGVVDKFISQRECELREEFVFDIVDLTLLQINPKRAKILEDLRSGQIQLKDLGFDHQNDKHMVTAAVQKDPSALPFASVELQYDVDFVKDLVQARGATLQYAPKALKLERDIVLAAVDSHGKALAYAPRALTRDRDIVRRAIEKDGLELLEYAHPDLLDDVDFMREILAPDEMPALGDITGSPCGPAADTQAVISPVTTAAAAERGVVRTAFLPESPSGCFSSLNFQSFPNLQLPAM